MSNGSGTIRHRYRHRHCSKAALSVALLATMPGVCAAFDIDYELGLAAKYSDNISLAQADPISDTVISPRLYFEVEQSGSAVEVSAQGQLEYLNYLDNTFADEVRGRLAAKLQWSVIPQRLDVLVQDYLSLQPVDQFVAFSPGNQQQVNVLVAGPTLHARFGNNTRGQLDLRYINSYAEESSAFDSDRYNAAVRVLHDINASNSVSANLEATDVRLDLVGGASDYRRYDGYVNSSIRRENITVSADLGSTRLRFEGQGWESYPLGRATFDWRLTPRSELRTTLRYQLNDAAQSLITPRELQRGDFNDFSLPDAVVDPNVFRERFARMRYAFDGERLDVSMGPYYRRIRYIENLVESQDRRGGSISIDYRLRPRLTLVAFAAAEHREYVDIARTDKDLSASIGLTNRFTRHWNGRIDVQRRERDSTESGRSYDENAVMVSLSYQR